MYLIKLILLWRILDAHLRKIAGWVRPCVNYWTLRFNKLIPKCTASTRVIYKNK